VPYGDTLTFSDDTSIFDVDPTSGQIAFTPSQEEVGRYNVTVTITDGDGNSASVTFSISITNVNDRPSIVDPGPLVAFEDELFSYNFTALDEDGDRQFSWTLVGSVGSMFMGLQSGRLTWVPEGEHVGTVNISVISRDPMGAADQINVSIEIVNVNDQPVLADLGRAQLTEGELFSYTVVIIDPDLEEDPSEFHTFLMEPELFSIPPSGIVAFTPTNDDVGTHYVNLTVTDAGGLSHTLLWEIVVININQPPVIEPVEEQIWHEDEQVLLLIISTDPDLGDRITFSDTTSMFDIDPRSGEINFTPAQNNVGRHDVRIHVQDEAGLYSDVYFTVTVLSHNDAPTVDIRVETLKQQLREGDMLSLAAVVEDEDNLKSDLHYIWFLNGKEVGEGDVIVLDDLKPGNHTVELRVADGDNSVSSTYSFDVEAVEENVPWIWAVVAAIVIVIVAFLGIKVFKAVQDTGQGEEAEEEPVVEEPEDDVKEILEDNPFENW
jgi:PKD repeat protein